MQSAITNLSVSHSSSINLNIIYNYHESESADSACVCEHEPCLHTFPHDGVILSVRWDYAMKRWQLPHAMLSSPSAHYRVTRCQISKFLADSWYYLYPLVLFKILKSLVLEVLELYLRKEHKTARAFRLCIQI